jgi:hypothetical protein
MEYLPAHMMPQSLFKLGELFDSRIDRYNGQDCFKGRVGATDIFFSELLVERKETRTDSKGHSSTHWVTVFKGIYLVADFHKDFQCRVQIMPDIAEATFGWLGRKFQGLSSELVRLENPEFERAFKVSSNDQVAARYLLTPDMQERFLTLRNQWNTQVCASLFNSSLHLAIPLRDNWFEASEKSPAGDLRVLEKFIDQFLSVLAITHTLDLNTRIWSKE